MSFKPIPGYTRQYLIDKEGLIYSLKSGMFLVPQRHDGYERVRLCKYGKVTKFYVHRLVLLTFVRRSLKEVNHKNGIKNDNRLSNLEYTTRSKNMKHAYDNGLYNKRIKMQALAC